MFEISTLLVCLGVGLVIYYGLQTLLRKPEHPPLPPGPKGLPLLGNLTDLPPPGMFEAHHWLKHKGLYGPISSITVMGQTIIIINDWKIASEVLEKRSAIHSSRPQMMMVGDLIGWDNSLAISPYGDRFRTHRKNMARIIGSKTAAAKYDTLQEAEVGHFLLHVLDQPDNFMDHIRREAGSVILKIAYGYTSEQFKEDVLINMAGKAMDDFGRTAVAGAFLVDIIPILRYVPEWVPGVNFKRLANQLQLELDDLVEKPYAFVKHQHAAGKQDNSFLTQLLDAGDATPEERTVSAIACFFLAMSRYPEVQIKAQEDIDRVIGNERLPDASDRSKLPYIDAIVKEVLRWHPVAPMGLPHTSTADDVFEGYFIPKDAIVMANIWGFAHDPEVHSEPERFNPERFLSTGGNQPEQDPSSYAFGFGRRICPGRILAENALFLNIAQSLAVFSISKDGKQVEPELRFTPGVVSHPERFKAVIKPRSALTETLIRSLEQKYPWQKSDGHILENMEPQSQRQASGAPDKAVIARVSVDHRFVNLGVTQLGIFISS
ncbi:hypothetical protein F53441_12429 [Fusarium austroafricanum]|uniref:Cytochrome P450 n=1 Tax=Fusarium austroafricanum TaxID=2364996 RepID=A0A8H4JZL1_9HYPO|nr:hypothetical protein F53441_12429 [Fusarium austroafricanum]